MPAIPADEAVRRIAACGAAGVEFWEPHLRLPDPAPVRAALADAGLGVALVSGYYNFTDPATAEASLTHARAVIARARAVGAMGLRIFTGKRRGGDADAATWARCAGMLATLCDEAPELAFAAELHDWNLMDTADNALRLVDAVARPNFGLILHAERLMPTPAAGIARLGAAIRHVHVRTDATGMPDPAMPWPEIIAALRGIGYAGWLSVEHFAPQPDACVPRAVAALRTLLV